ncbi:MAG: 16S rRNA (cytosine(1402)-N(4))-methyltransferase RsmH [Mycoplasmataceae bacterium]|jgi:16S rRNA (cytosine1402-N4)-methyltransferase|nr:16S rRNA (cytosine(1402)-N(4))-methyltransferase RsmH [Mycoplasmataceae bacterium]
MIRPISLHAPVLLNEVIQSLNINPHGVYVDGTAGRGGHSQAILNKLTDGKLVCMDTDQEAIIYLEDLFGKQANVTVVRDNFKDLKNALYNLNLPMVDGILLDLGVSSPMFDDATRGFSYHHDGPLDMRMDQTLKLDAAFVVNKYDERQLTTMFKMYGEITNCRPVVQAIVDYRKHAEIKTTQTLVDIIKGSVNKKELFKDKHPARKYFQAIRIEVNQELHNLKKVVSDIPDLLKPKGRAAVITFHSLEDRIVKQGFHKKTVSSIPKEVPLMDQNINFKLVNKKPIEATPKEIEENHRARSAKLRVIERIK